jgi:tetratricopeptide (TPR) repeat protein
MALESNESPGRPIAKFESMLKTDDVYFFDAEDFEDIIHHYLNNGKIALAKKAIKIGLQQHTDSIELKLLNVEVLVFENNLGQAEELLDKLQLLDASNEEIYIQRANIYSKKDNHEAAIVLLHKALQLSDNAFDIHSLMGMEYLFMDDFKLAKENFMKCVSFDEQDYSSLYNVIYCFEFLEDFDGAIFYLNDYLDRNPYCEVAWHQLGKQYFEKCLYKEALTAFDFAIISDDSFIGAYFEKGKVLERLGKYEEAIENYETTINIEDPTSHAYLRIGKCHEKLNNYDMAKYYYYQTVHEDPLLDKGWLAITDFYFQKRDAKKALYYINKALNIDGENPLYWKKCAQINADLEDFHKADYAYKQAVDLGNYELDTWLKWSQVTYKNNDLGATIQILTQGKEFYPENAKLPYLLAGYQLLADDPINARITLMDALKLDIEKLFIFEEEFPQFAETEWALNIISHIKKTSR